MKKILLINDSKLESMIMKDTLSSIGYNVTVTDEYNAVISVHDFCPDFIIVNLVMKEIYGDQLASVIKIQYPDIKCILSSSNAIDINNFNRQRIDAVIRTPIDKSELRRVLEGIDPDFSREEDDSDHYEVKKYCSTCAKFIVLNLDSELFFCPFCGRKL